ncbi:prion-inhibition and propagation-domain-containing protein [Daldinia vernicosa]|uniref:prion-inhibition and propagation-domain-containing protein n=1 Tax=Daldinia vernicosa TaxID=114800 RepID=UPI0020089138|nr:prion-inhibition and propagation-domain-containing protein [Daldinia vernicosa]KAI0845572.1 prion-inhibition and propagation-domain-containing protein [Daldinia vernicosa]
MAEVAGLVVGAVGIAAAFKGAVETGIFVRSLFEAEAADCSDLGLYYPIEKQRLRLWGKQCKVNDPSSCILRDKTSDIKDLIIQTLGRIKKLSEEADDLVEKYNIGTPKVPGCIGDLNDNLRPDGPVVHDIAKLSKETKPMKRISWVVFAKDNFKEKIEAIRLHITHLHQITLEYRETELLENSPPGRVLPYVNNHDDLRTLSGLGPIAHQPLAISALAKLYHQITGVDLHGSATRLTKNDLKLTADGTLIKVRVEWVTLRIGLDADAQKYVDRMNSLGYVLEKASVPALRLGYVFGLPPDESRDGYDIYYERDLYTYPPIQLSRLIKDRKTKIPLLGDRFQLAYVLTCAFSCFHAAGWIHKGLHTGSIYFFKECNGEIDGESSLAYTPLERREVEHYYHPDAHNGFTKKKDLYSLGVVLCEIGRWALLAEQKKKPNGRSEWRNLMLGKPLADLGWRMGGKYHSAVRELLECRFPDDDAPHDYFAEQFLEKVMKPLSSCSA